MGTITSIPLRDLHHKSLGIEMENASKRAVPFDLLGENFGFHSHAFSWDLLESNERCPIGSPEYRESHHALIAHGGDFNAGAVIHKCNNRDDAAQGKINIIDLLERFIDALLQRYRHAFKFRQKAAVFTWR